MAILSLPSRNINDLFPEVSEAVIKHKPFKYFAFYYKLLTDKKPEFNFYRNTNYSVWVDYLLDSYNKYKSAGFTDYESQVNSIMDGLEALLKGDSNDTKKHNKKGL